VVQAHARGALARFETARKRASRRAEALRAEERRAVERDAATKIQAAIRGALGRREAAARRRKNASHNVRGEEEGGDGAAGWRAYSWQRSQVAAIEAELAALRRVVVESAAAGGGRAGGGDEDAMMDRRASSSARRKGLLGAARARDGPELPANWRRGGVDPVGGGAAERTRREGGDSRESVSALSRKRVPRRRASPAWDDSRRVRAWDTTQRHQRAPGAAVSSDRSNGSFSFGFGGEGSFTVAGSSDGESVSGSLPSGSGSTSSISPGSRIVAAAEKLAKRYHENPLWGDDAREALEDGAGTRGGRGRRWVRVGLATSGEGTVGGGEGSREPGDPLGRVAVAFVFVAVPRLLGARARAAARVGRSTGTPSREHARPDDLAAGADPSRRRRVGGVARARPRAPDARAVVRL
jgi:hypothetical protein